MKKYILISLSILISLLACDKDEADRSYARIKTLGVQSINANGVTISAEIYDASKLNIEDHGFVYNLKSSPLPENSGDNTHFEAYFEKESLGSKNGDGIFETTLTRNLIKDTIYTAKAYVFSNGITTYGEAIEFDSEGGIAPVISKIVPDTAYYGDTISIVGNNFSTQTHFNKISFNELEAKIVSSSDTLIRTIIPAQNWKWKAVSKIKMKLGDSEIQSLPNFYIHPPQIDSASCRTVVSGMNVKIYGSYFKDLYGLKVDGKNIYYNNFKKISDSLISLQIPYSISVGKIPISYSYLQTSDSIIDFFESTKPVIESVKPTKFWIDTTLKISGPFVKYISGFYKFGTPNIINDSLVHIKIMSPPNTNKIFGYYNGEEIQAQDSIEWLPPIVRSINPSVGYTGEKIIFLGERFLEGMKLKIDDKFYHLNYINENTAEFTIPEINSGTHIPELYYSSRNFGKYETASFEIPDIKILDVNPKIVQRGNIIELYLENFNSDNNTSVTVGNCGTSIIEKKDDYIKAKITNGSLLSETVEVKINNGGRRATFNEALQGKEPWENVLYVDDLSLDKYFFVTPNNTPILILRNSNYKLYNFYESTKELQFKCEYGMDYGILKAFSRNDKIYFTTRYRDEQDHLFIKIGSYSITSNEWLDETSILDNEDRYHLFSFIKNDEIYIGDNKSLKSYNILTKKWTDKTPLPTNEWRVEDVVTNVIDNNCYVSIKNGDKSNDDSISEFWRYNIDSDTWNYISGCPYYYYPDSGSSFTSSDDKIFAINMGSESIANFLVFDPNNNNWIPHILPPGRCRRTISFVYNDYLYVGHDDKYNQELNLKRIHLNNLIKLEE